MGVFTKTLDRIVLKLNVFKIYGKCSQIKLLSMDKFQPRILAILTRGTFGRLWSPGYRHAPTFRR